ncbi:hypothetical protein DFH09DRAFT_1420247 [Mycena vulgaris]|nr:hypothetical protein DFH09DRAFT_1420247 [Mycena vulgaris]
MLLLRILRYILDNVLDLVIHLAILVKDILWEVLLAAPFEEEHDIDDEMLEILTRVVIWIKSALYNALYAPHPVEGAAPNIAAEAVEGFLWQRVWDFFNTTEASPPAHRWLVSPQAPAGSLASHSGTYVENPLRLFYRLTDFLLAQYADISVQQWTSIGIIALAILVLSARALARLPATPTQLDLGTIVEQEPIAQPIPAREPERHVPVDVAAEDKGPLPQEAPPPRPRTPSSPFPAFSPPSTPLVLAAPDPFASPSFPSTPRFASPEIACASTPRRPLPRTMQVARRLLQLGAARVVSTAELRVLQKWARLSGPAGGVHRETRSGDADADVDALLYETDSAPKKTSHRMWRGRRWGAAA